MTQVFSEHHEEDPPTFMLYTNPGDRVSGLRTIEWCRLCGWWKATDFYDREIRVTLPFAIRRVVEGAAGSLRELDLSDLNLPLDEVRKYLVAKYKSRFEMNPRLFEHTVGSVFRSLGYEALVTAYSGDEGIDVVLEKDSRQIGVQVKCTKRSINVEQIRSLVGALVLKGMTEGIFITTSSFQRGGKRTTALGKVRGYRIKLVDAPRFYDALKLAQAASVPENMREGAGEYFRKMKILSDEPPLYW